jgi:hypothetical protein
VAAGTDALLLEIARCPNVRRCFDSPALAHPCSTVVAAQGLAPDDLHVPEPWNGQLETAPILFVSWNPSWNPSERFATRVWTDEAILEFFRTRFDHSDQNSQTWREMPRIAEHLLGRPARAGVDYAVTDVVRCKSWNGKGATAALAECTGRYLRRTLDASGARVVVGLGRDARRTLASHFGVDEALGAYGPITSGGRERMIVLLGAPGSAQARRLTPEECLRVRAHLAVDD